eukprot:CAMPEP_0168194134 /NCGR_PEP_ID=MMETSP0139_2-20121125/19012_1 /TAXON_ID=44445 /ORGANISM="Pseudo-nitzschia australis, Strain 10249 10 AB" /LENGTH=70 /DNA_ID=CAMNT_0008117605 /DNA_START=103 /DNA_END=315 /DNA_ORIENTATION=+
MDEAGIIKAFSLFDPDGTGKVNSEELVEALTTYSDMSTDDAKQLIKDAGGKSKFDYASFVKSMNAKMNVK